MRRARSSIGPIGAILVLSSSLAVAAPDEPTKHYELEHTGEAFLLGESAVALGAWSGALFATGGPSAHCRWCQSNSFDASVRNTLRADDPGPPAIISHALSVGAIPVLGLTGLVGPATLDGKSRRGLEDAWIVTNTFLVTSAVGDFVKNLVARERPSFHNEVESKTEFANWPSERNKSFFSLDTAWAFAIASSSASLAYLRGYSTAPYIAAGGGVLALGAGTLRIVGDAHWATDVVTGAIVGTGIGIAMPLLLHGRRSDVTSESASTGLTALSITPAAQGSGISVAFAF